MRKRSWVFEWKKLCLVMLVLCLAFSLSACGGTEDNGEFAVHRDVPDEDDPYEDFDEEVQENGETASDVKGAGTETPKKNSDNR